LVSAGSSHVVEFVLPGSVINEVCHPVPNDEEVKKNAMSELVQNRFRNYSDEEIRRVYDEACYIDNNPNASRQEMIEYLLWDACWNAVDDKPEEERTSETLYEDDDYMVVDNKQDYDFIGYIENFTDKTIAILFEVGDYDVTDDESEIIWDEDDWSIDRITFNGLEECRALVEENPSDLELVEIEPNKWCGFPADNRGRSMFNALKKHFSK